MGFLLLNPQSRLGTGFHGRGEQAGNDDGITKHGGVPVPRPTNPIRPRPHPPVPGTELRQKSPHSSVPGTEVRSKSSGHAGKKRVSAPVLAAAGHGIP